jgi:hypothetical protein
MSTKLSSKRRVGASEHCNGGNRTPCYTMEMLRDLLFWTRRYYEDEHLDQHKTSWLKSSGLQQKNDSAYQVLKKQYALNRFGAAAVSQSESKMVKLLQSAVDELTPDFKVGEELAKDKRIPHQHWVATNTGNKLIEYWRTEAPQLHDRMSLCYLPYDCSPFCGDVDGKQEKLGADKLVDDRTTNAVVPVALSDACMIRALHYMNEKTRFHYRGIVLKDTTDTAINGAMEELRSIWKETLKKGSSAGRAARPYRHRVIGLLFKTEDQRWVSVLIDRRNAKVRTVEYFDAKALEPDMGGRRVLHALLKFLHTGASGRTDNTWEFLVNRLQHQRLQLDYGTYALIHQTMRTKSSKAMQLMPEIRDKEAMKMRRTDFFRQPFGNVTATDQDIKNCNGDEWRAKTQDEVRKATMSASARTAELRRELENMKSALENLKVQGLRAKQERDAALTATRDAISAVANSSPSAGALTLDAANKSSAVAATELKDKSKTNNQQATVVQRLSQSVTNIRKATSETVVSIFNVFRNTRSQSAAAEPSAAASSKTPSSSSSAAAASNAKKFANIGEFVTNSLENDTYTLSFTANNQEVQLGVKHSLRDNGRFYIEPVDKSQVTQYGISSDMSDLGLVDGNYQLGYNGGVYNVK